MVAGPVSRIAERAGRGALSRWLLPRGAPSERYGMRPAPTLAALALLPAPAVFAQEARPTQDLVLARVAVVDVRGGTVRRDQTVVIRGNRIEAIGGASAVRVRGNARVVDAAGKFVIPGLWDMHTHFFTSGRAGSFPLLYVANGVTGVRDLGTRVPLSEVAQLRREIAAGTSVGPRLAAVAGPILDGPRSTRAGPHMLTVATAEEARRAADSLVRAGADYLKVYSLLPREAFFAVAEEARRLGVPVAGHLPGEVSALEASDAGMRSIEHLAGMYFGDGARARAAGRRARASVTAGGLSVPPMGASSHALGAAG